jgi:CubicO group peptidase (beta-lactamase class C family)
MRFAFVFAGVAAAVLRASDSYPPPRFTDPDRIKKLESALPEIDIIFQRYATEHKIPGMVWGVVIDSRLAHVGSTGVRERTSNAPITPDTPFRIASMTKSFTTLAILKLRDEGKLSLDDPVSKWIPEFERMELPTRDSAPLRIRQLLSHSAGLPEDNPWGDQQLNASDADVTSWLRRGIPFSTPPSTRYEYSNYAFGLLGRIVSRASRMGYERYVTTEILAKLHMDGSTFQFSNVPAANRAIGYRLQPDGTYLEEPPLPQGAFSSAGGLLTTATDMGKYIAFQLSAWPPRDDPEMGPVRRSSVREMSWMWTPANLTASHSGGKLEVTEAGYGFGLRISTDCRFEHIVGHGGGLPGFGSYMMWLPDYGVGMFAMATLTYSGPSAPISQALDEMLRTGGLQKRVLAPSPFLTEVRTHILNLWQSWNDAEAKQIAAMNLFRDVPAAQRRAEILKLKTELGECPVAGPIIPENWLRGQFNLTCAKGRVGVFFTLSPTEPPAVQYLEFRKIESDTTRLSAPTGAPAGVACRE